MKLGEMLVRDGRLSEGQLTQVLTQQGHGGSKLGTVLFEAGLIDLDALTVYLGLELGIPIASGAMLERAKRSAVRLLTPTQALQHRCVPLMVQDRQLIAAVDDPLDFDNLDALADITGYRIIPRVAPEIRIYYYVERFYGAARPQRFARFGETPRGDQPAPAGLPAPPLPGLPPVATSIVAPPGPTPHLRRAPSISITPFDNSEALELEAEDLLDALDADDAAPAEAAPIAAAAGAPAAPAPRLSGRISTPVMTAEPLDAEQARAAIAAATERGQVADALMRFATGIFDVTVLFIVRDNLALGSRAAGAAPGTHHVEHLLIPLDAPSLLQSALKADDGFWDGVPRDNTVHGYFYKVLGVGEPARATAGLVAIGRRVVNIVYGHREGREPADEVALASLREMCRTAAEAYARLIAASKQQRDAKR